jgi:hypothetical protein
MKTASFLRRLLLLIAGATGAAFVLAPALAAAAPSQSFQISPPVSNYSGDHGNTVSGKLKVTNLTNVPLAVHVTKQNFAAKGEEGEIELVNNADPLYSLAPWFSYTATDFTLPGLGSKTIDYNVAIPGDAEPGGRYGALLVSSVPPRLPSGQSGAAVQQEIAGVVFMRINGQAKEELSLASFQTGHYTANSKAFSATDFFQYGPVDFLTRIRNTGNVHEKPTGTITIKNMLGMKVGSVALDEHFVIPGAIRRLHNVWPAGKQKPFLFGRYTAQLNAKYGGDKTLSASTSFTVIPWKQVIIVLIILLILFLIVWRGRKRFARAFRILAGKE